MSADFPLRFATFAAFLACSAAPARAGLHLSSVTPGTVPWPAGTVPYVIDVSLSADQRQTYLDGLREWELAANVHFIPRTTQTQYVLFKYSPGGPNLVSGSNPQTVEINLLTRGQICHEMGHSFGLEHEHQRPNRDTYITVLYGNVTSGNSSPFDILPGSVSFGAYDFESVMHYGRDVYTTAPGLDTIQTKPGYEKYQRRLSNAALSPVDRAHLASLYGAPAVPLSPVVTTTADGGVGSLRAAMYYAQDHPGTTVTFNIPTSDPGYAGGAFTIKPTGYLPPLATNGLIIDATTQPGYAGKPVVFVNGSKLIAEVGQIPAFLFLESNNMVKGLGIQQYPWCGMVMRYPEAVGNRVLGCSMGVGSNGNSAAANAFQGIMISDGAHGNFVGGTGTNERNVISGNTQYGVYIAGASTSQNTVAGNYIGTNMDGNAALPNNQSGVILTDGASQNIIGPGNVISGNTQYGMWISGATTTGNTVMGNYIGTNRKGDAALPNQISGLILTGQANQNTIGGATAAARNVISGNNNTGVYLTGGGTTGNRVLGNYIGTSATGNASVPNTFAGVYIIGGCSENYLGDGPGTGNLISGNATVGVLVADPGTSGNFIRNNRIGPSAAGAYFANQFDGVWMTNGSVSNVIGGTSAGAANTIAGNPGRGIVLFNAPTAGQTFQRNSIYANGWQGIALDDGSNHSQTAPVISSAVLGLGTTVSGSLTSTASTTFTIEFFSSPDSRNFVGSTVVTTSSSGVSSFNVVLPAIVKAGHSISATATSQATGDTSEFSPQVVVTTSDSDSDGLPNAYEAVTPGLNSSNPADAALDNDGDGFTNLQEFIAGTNPNNSGSQLVATGVVSGNTYVVSFGTVNGKFYRLERSETLSGVWETIAVHLGGTGSVVAVPVPISSSIAKQFFRVTAAE